MRKQIAVYTFIGISLAIRTASAQLVSFGVKGGLSLTDPTFTNYHSPRYIVGPSIEFRLPAHFAVEIAALYNHTSTTSAFTISPGPSAGTSNNYLTTTKGNSWQLPILGKYYFGSEQSKWRPYVGTGYAFGSTWYHQKGTTTMLSGTTVTGTTPIDSSYRSNTSVGALVAAGLRYKKGRFAILPEVRYTYWGANSYPIRQNAAAFLLGFQF